MRLRDTIEIGAADELPAGTYWALWFMDDRGANWLELVKQRPRCVDGKAAVRFGNRVELPDGRVGLVFEIVTIQKNRKVRYARGAERLAAGDLVAVVPQELDEGDHQRADSR
jgi:hypothetical protein